MLGNGVIKTIDGDDDIYISLGQICEYMAVSARNMQVELEKEKAPTSGAKKYAQGLLDMMHTITKEFIELGKFEAQRRLINTPEDLLKLSENK